MMIRSKTRIGPVLNIKVCYRDEQYCVEVQVPFLFKNQTVSCVRIVNRVDRYVTESILTKEEEEKASVKPSAKARPRKKLTVTLTSISIPVLDRIWIDIEAQRSHDQKCFDVQKPLPDCYVMIKQSRERDGAIHYVTSSKIVGIRSSTTLRSGYLKNGYRKKAKGGGAKKKSMLRESKLFQSILVPSSNPRTIRR